MQHWPCRLARGSVSRRWCCLVLWKHKVLAHLLGVGCEDLVGHEDHGVGLVHEGCKVFQVQQALLLPARKAHKGSKGHLVWWARLARLVYKVHQAHKARLVGVVAPLLSGLSMYWPTVLWMRRYPGALRKPMSPGAAMRTPSPIA